MPLGKQAKVLNKHQIQTTLSHLSTTCYKERDQTLFLLSVKAGLRAKEIASLTWAMVTDAEGNLTDYIQLPDIASKGKSGRSIPINKDLKQALLNLKHRVNVEELDDHTIYSQRGSKMTPNSIVMWFNRIYKRLGYDGCSSHSGRRTFITNTAQKISLVGGSLRDIQQLAGHASLQTTQRYVEGNSEAKQKVVNII